MNLKQYNVDKRIKRVHYTPSNPHQAGGLRSMWEMYWRTVPNLTSRWKRIRRAWMKEQEKIYGKSNLTCAICGKTKLNPWAGHLNKDVLATCDHIIPFQRAPHLWDDPNNFQIACLKCNSSKENMV